MKIGVIIIALFFSYFTHVKFLKDDIGNENSAWSYQEKDKDKKKKKDGKKKDDKTGEKKEVKKNPKVPKQYRSDHTVEVTNTWTLPASLKEISGMTFIDENTLACIQDETGEIFIYDLTQKKITRTISFAGPGDYEGIANVKGVFYIIRSDGTLIKADPKKVASPETFQTGLSIQNNCEGLFYDAKNNRLLIAIKADDPGPSPIKGIYSFDLTTMKGSTKPVAHIDLENPALADTSKKKDIAQRRYHPSDLAIDPVTGDYMIVNGVNSSLMILSPQSQIRKIISLDKKTFPQPEGIAYSPGGKLFISSEGGAGNGIIAECRIVK